MKKDRGRVKKKNLSVKAARIKKGRAKKKKDDNNRSTGLHFTTLGGASKRKFQLRGEETGTSGKR